MVRKIVVCVILAACLLIVLCTTASAATDVMFDSYRFLQTSGGESTSWSYDSETDEYSGLSNDLFRFYSLTATKPYSLYDSFGSGSYTIYFSGCSPERDVVSIGFNFLYSDGTRSTVFVNSSEYLDYSLSSDPSKTVIGLYVSMNYNVLVKIKNFKIVKNLESLSSYSNVIPNDVIDFFRDLVSSESILDDYVAVCDGDSSYSLFVGDLDYAANKFSSKKIIKRYSIHPDSDSDELVYTCTDVSGFNFNTEHKIVYSNLGDFPNLLRKGELHEVLQTILIATVGCSLVVSSIFNSCKRRS